MTNSHRMGSTVRAALAAAALSTSLGLMAGLAPVASAQDATPTALPECVAPALPPGEPTPMDMASPEAMPGMEMPPAASPVAEAAGAPADEATTEAAVAAATNLASCLQTNPEGALALMTPELLLAQFGTENPYDVLAMGMLDGFMLDGFTTGAVYTYDDGSVSVDVQYNQGPYQVVGERWTFIDDAGTWKINALAANTPVVEGDTTVVGVNMIDYGFEFNVSQIVETEVLMLHVINAGAEPHEIVVFRMPEGATVEDIAADPEGTLAEDAFIGALFAPVPGEQADLVLVGLEPGKYVAVCFIPTADGTPHFAEGMIAEFEILGL